ncbi:Predicted nucleic-acid-binding protein, contains Zn-ribbon domain [Halorubrum aquaticum]|uniref:Predicted nucleic-acid-binding protein, contains Zn-ribbon domain n=1 Tax=Halorubrum aquaticum TaxID=387340 RepID=A0A1I3BQ18_9EURY|nr:zinc ribbon domain-containing protein [Halorubrum aquaticum]SFH64408.1 Predicted nucleic-acid-binding protein, contains Zn-ribbon domain [Halorubrum aquaticum]
MPSDDNDTSYSVFGDDSTDAGSGGGDRATGDDDGPGPGRAEYDDESGDWNESRADADPETLGSDDTGCPKCGGEETETDEIATSGTGLTKLFDVQNRRFVVVSCANCGYSELYKGQSKHDAIDFFVG